MIRIEGKPNTNTKEFWNNYYAVSDERQRIIIYEHIVKYIWNSQMKVLEIGCGIGLGLDYLKKIFPNLQCEGCDFSDVAIKIAQKSYPDIKFFEHDILKDQLSEQYDCIIIAETLEHLEEPFKAIDKYLKHCKKLLLSLPYCEDEHNDKEHLFCKITKESFSNYSIQKTDVDGRYFRLLINSPVKIDACIENLNEINNLKPNILIIDSFNNRDYLQWNIYKKLMQNNNFNIYICQEIDGEIENIMSQINIDRIDLVFIGIYHGKILHNSMEYIKRNNIPCIIDSADNEEFCSNENISSIIKSGIVNAVIVKYFPLDKLNIFLNDLSFDISKLHCIEWGIEPTENIQKKDIDVTFIASITDGWIYHAQRKLIKKILEGLKGYKIFTDNVYDNEYKNVLSLSKIFIVEGSMRDSMVQKYLEAGISGCLLIGERPLIPTIAYENFTNDVMTEVVNWDDLNNVIINSLNNPKEMQHKVDNCIRMIKEKFNINDKVLRDEELFKNLIQKK